MELYYEMLLREQRLLMGREDVERFQLAANNWVEMECYQAMVKIKNILEDDSLQDEECFCQIEKIVNVFEDLGSGCGNRHDFG